MKTSKELHESLCAELNQQIMLSAKKQDKEKMAILCRQINHCNQQLLLKAKFGSGVIKNPIAIKRTLFFTQ